MGKRLVEQDESHLILARGVRLRFIPSERRLEAQKRAIGARSTRRVVSHFERSQFRVRANQMPFLTQMVHHFVSTVWTSE